MNTKNSVINVASYIDHTQLKADSTIDDIITLCDEAIRYNFYAVCVNSSYVQVAKEHLQPTNNAPVKIAATVGFPLGAMSTIAKAKETEQACKDGADEIDMVISIGLLKSARYQEVLADMKAVKQAAEHHIVKVIFENCLLSNEEKKRSCDLAVEAGVDFIKTSTGFTTGSRDAHGATKDDILLMRDAVRHTDMRIKAAGGVKNFHTALEYIALGVSRIGTSSGIAIITGAPVNNNQY